MKMLSPQRSLPIYYSNGFLVQTWQQQVTQTMPPLLLLVEVWGFFKAEESVAMVERRCHQPCSAPIYR